MSFQRIGDIPSPQQLRAELPVPERFMAGKRARDLELAAIICNQSKKFLVIVGPCSASDEEAVCEYTSRLAKTSRQLYDKLFIIPRIFTMKPRTRGQGYKGILHQPVNGKEPDLAMGLKMARALHLRAGLESGLTAADELLYPELYEYFKDVVSYLTVGARSVENQQHRFVASGADGPVGMKNPTSGNISTLLHSIYAAQHGHQFIYRGCEVKSSGNPFAHAIIRGYEDFNGGFVPNYRYGQLLEFVKRYRGQGLTNPLIICDASHGNSGKNYGNEAGVIRDVLDSRSKSEEIAAMVRGVMIESFIEEGRQEPPGRIYGKSVTDGCIGWNATEELLYYIADHI